MANKPTPPEKAKLIVRFRTYSSMVLDADNALVLLEMLRKAERHEMVYNSVTANSTQHIFPYDDEEIVEIHHITDSQYAMAKVRGKPVKE